VKESNGPNLTLTYLFDKKKRKEEKGREETMWLDIPKKRSWCFNEEEGEKDKCD